MKLLDSIDQITQKLEKITKRVMIVLLTVLPFFLAWFAIGQVIQSHLTIDELIKVTGIIDGTKEVTTHVRKGLFYTHKDTELRVYLKDTYEYFRLMDIYHYHQFSDKLQQGDTAEIYIRPKWLVTLGMGYRNDIFQMAVNGQTVFDISQTHRNENGIAFISFISIPIFVYLGRWARKKMREKGKQQATVGLMP